MKGAKEGGGGGNSSLQSSLGDTTTGSTPNCPSFLVALGANEIVRNDVFAIGRDGALERCMHIENVR